MRITDNIRLHQLTRNLHNLTARQAIAAEQSSTGLKLTSASVDPMGASQVSRIRSDLGQAKTFRANIETAQGDVRTAEGALGESINLLNRARELAMQGSNDAMSAADRAILAGEVVSLRDQLLNMANVEGSYGYLFSGFQSDTPAFSALGTYQGDQGQKQLEVGRGVTVPVALNGDVAFEGVGVPGGVNIFSELENLESALLSDDGAAIAGTLEGIDGGTEQLILQRSQAGLTLNRLEIADVTLEQAELSLIRRESDVADADAFETLSELNQVTTTLDQAIRVARTTLNLNLNRF